MTATNIWEMTTNSSPLNTGGISQGAWEMGPIYKVALIPAGKQFTYTEMLTPYATLQALIENNNPALRAYVIGDFVDAESIGQAETTGTTGYGLPTYEREGTIAIKLMWSRGGMTYEKVLKSLQGMQDAYDLIIFDRDTNSIIGAVPGDNSSSYVLRGFDLSQLYSPTITLPDGKKRTGHSLVIGLSDTDQFTKRHKPIQLDPVKYPLMDLNSLINLEINPGKASGSPFTATTVRLKLTTSDEKIDLYATYGAAFVALAASCSAITDSTGAALTISSLALHPATKSILCTFASPTAANATVTFFSPTVAQMKAGSMAGFGNTSVQLTAV